ncbi:MAG: hypothetical protein JWO15_3527 [Sphingomonadales bacterium]|nr:hypothetical protein [Sphingomonadales bacterium]
MHRKEYMAPCVSDADSQERHNKYYGQYVTDLIKQLVSSHIGVDRIRDSIDPAFNDIPLKRWDALVPLLPRSAVYQLSENGDFLSLGTGVCILKAAARTIKDSTNE